MSVRVQKRKSRIFVSKTENINVITDHIKSKSLDGSNNLTIPGQNSVNNRTLKPLKLAITDTFVINLNPLSDDEYGNDISSMSESDSVYTSDNLSQIPSVSEEHGLDLDEPIYHINYTWK
mmetsp:Transcript_83839/g.102702  ORF Transcript_83839/g.102702 Transcript_83839/m.102702 type:complete len:120 (-) Transcript_83839:4-363(-)